jgi:hypothetical protein
MISYVNYSLIYHDKSSILQAYDCEEPYISQHAPGVVVDQIFFDYLPESAIFQAEFRIFFLFV